MHKQFRTIYVPINVVGEVAGSIYFNDALEETKGLGRIMAN
tara:strand:- start:342 stop:464 length:123 start_codon:yes stop_codon:yes gene_type:complete